jgi:hypothetical protein
MSMPLSDPSYRTFAFSKRLVAKSIQLADGGSSATMTAATGKVACACVSTATLAWTLRQRRGGKGALNRGRHVWQVHVKVSHARQGG